MLRYFCILQVVRGVLVLHKAGISHLDIKPQNILCKIIKNDVVRRSMSLADQQRYRGDATFAIHIKITDFEFAKKKAEWTPPRRYGTRRYLAPELCSTGAPVQREIRAIDRWALGCTIFEIITGRGLFGGDEDKSSTNPEKPWQVLNPDLDLPSEVFLT